MTRSRATAKRKSSRSFGQAKPEKDLKQLVVTLTASNGEIAKIEHLGSTGKRRAFSDAEFATLAGDDDGEDVYRLLEDAYTAGIRDGFEEALSEDPFGESGTSSRQQSKK